MSKIKQILSLPNAKAIINQGDKDQQTALFHAGLHEDEQFGLQVVNMLLKYGGDPYHKQDNKQTLISWLAANNKYKILQRMLQFNYNLNQNDNYGQTPLFFAASKGRLKCAQLLIKNGSDIHHVDSQGQTVLFWAASGGHLEMCKQLINRGCNPWAVDKSKKTAMTFAKMNHHTHVVNYLVGLKKEKEREKERSKVSNSESVQIEKKGNNKKKQTIKGQYFLVYTGDDGQTRPLKIQQTQQFLFNHPNISTLLTTSQQLQSLSIPQPSFYYIANRILTSLLKRQDTIAFHEPVKYQQLKLYDYPNIIPHPMDYSTMKHKLSYNAYKNQEDFSKDICLVYENCIKYNGENSDYGRLANRLKEEYVNGIRKEFEIMD